MLELSFNVLNQDRLLFLSQFGFLIRINSLTVFFQINFFGYSFQSRHCLPNDLFDNFGVDFTATGLFLEFAVESRDFTEFNLEVDGQFGVLFLFTFFKMDFNFLLFDFALLSGV